MTRRQLAAACAALVGLATPRVAIAGGFEMPSNGSEALGRGGAFVAKADDPTAIEFNPAGLASQRGTRLLLDGHVIASSYGLQRYGAFPGSGTDPKNPWGGSAYPRVSDSSGPFFAPFLAASSDFGTFDWMTFAVGVFGPSGVGNRTYPLGVAGAPAASRYDVVQSNSIIAMPTAAVGIKVFDGLELGAALHFVYGQFALTSTSFVDLGDGPAGPCVNYEYQPCDSVSRLDLSGTSWAGTFGAMVRPSRTLSMGLSARTPISMSATGTATVLQSPLGQPIPAPGHATFENDLPWVLRAGVRQAFRDLDGFETADVEVDGTYETWGTQQAGGPVIHIDHLGPTGPAFDNLSVHVAHRYNDTFSLRAGGAYNTKLSLGRAAAGGLLRPLVDGRQPGLHAPRLRHPRQDRRNRRRGAEVGRPAVQRELRRGLRARSYCPRRDGADPAHRRLTARRAGGLAGTAAAGGQRGGVPGAHRDHLLRRRRHVRRAVRVEARVPPPARPESDRHARRDPARLGAGARTGSPGRGASSSPQGVRIAADPGEEERLGRLKGSAWPGANAAEAVCGGPSDVKPVADGSPPA